MDRLSVLAACLGQSVVRWERWKHHNAVHLTLQEQTSQRPDAFGCHVATLFWSCGSLSTYRPRLFQALLSHSKAVHSKGCILAGGGGMGVR